MPRNRVGPVFALVLAVLLLGLAGCVGASPGSDSGQPASANLVVSYAAAAGRLSGLDTEDAQDQVRDWALTALAERIGLSQDQFRDASYDTLPVRDSAFTDLSRQPSGPGREIYDGAGVLHLLVPVADPQSARTIGLLLDQYRADAGTDAPRVQVHRYAIDASTMTVAIYDGPISATAQVRAANGYVSQEVDTQQELADFLAKTSYLSQLDLRGDQVWATGWNWPAPADAKVDLTDVSVLQRGYLDTSGLRPGFSLDPQQITTTADLTAVVPGLSKRLAQRVITGNWAGSPFTSAADLDTLVRRQLYDHNVPAATLARDGLPTDRTQLWALDAQLNGLSAYSEARYDGGIAGTAVGMTLFYTDYVAKNWSVGTGSGSPAGTVAGFLPNDKAATPWSLCAAGSAEETGRLWFGENDAAVRTSTDSVSIGAQATRLFARSDSPGGGEVQPSYDLGRGLTWWDQHYLAVSDYEPQYQRLDAIMRWSEALDWLAAKTSAQLPQLPNGQLTSNLRFADWYAQHDELRDRTPVDFVHPPSAKQESLSHLPTVTYHNCGEQEIQGGVSLADGIERQGDRPSATLPPDISRAGGYDAASTFNEATGGQLDQDLVNDLGQSTGQIDRAVSTQGDTTTVRTTAPGEPLDTFGGLKITQSANTPRVVTLTTTVLNGQIAQEVAYQGVNVGTVTTTDTGRIVSVAWQPGPLDRVRTILNWIQRTITGHPVDTATGALPIATDGALASVQTPDGVVYDLGGAPTDPWLEISDNGNNPPPGGTLSFQVGEPDPEDGGNHEFIASLVPPPHLGGDWALITPASGGHLPTIQSGDAPDTSAMPITVTTADGKRSTIYAQHGQFVASATDPILGVAGTGYGMALASHLPAIEQAMTTAAKTKDALVGVLLGDAGVALVRPDWLHLDSATSPLYAQLTEITRDNPNTTIWYRLDNGRPEMVAEPELGPPTNTWETTFGAVRAQPDTVIYLNEVYRNTLSLGPAPLVTSSLPITTRVKVRSFTVSGNGNGSGGGGSGNSPFDSFVPPDFINNGGGGWDRIDPPGEGFFIPLPLPTNTTTTPTSAGALASSAGATQVLLVCPADTAGVAGCQS